MRKIEIIAVLLLVVVFCANIAKADETKNASAIVSLNQLSSAIDKKVDQYMVGKTTDAAAAEDEFDELVDGVKTDIERSSDKSKVEFGDVVIALGKIYEKRATSSAPQIVECNKSSELTENCVSEILKYNRNRVVITTLGLAIVGHYLGPVLKEFESDKKDNPVRKFLEQKLKKE